MGKMVISILMCQFHAAGQHIHEALVREHVEREKCGFWGVQWSNFPLSRLKTTGIHTGNSPWHAGVSLMFVSVYRWNKQIKQEIASQCVCENCQKARADNRSKRVLTPPLPSFRKVDGPTGANACSLPLPSFREADGPDWAEHHPESPGPPVPLGKDRRVGASPLSLGPAALRRLFTHKHDRIITTGQAL